MPWDYFSCWQDCAPFFSPLLALKRQASAAAGAHGESSGPLESAALRTFHGLGRKVQGCAVLGALCFNRERGSSTSSGYLKLAEERLPGAHVRSGISVGHPFILSGGI